MAAGAGWGPDAQVLMQSWMQTLTQWGGRMQKMRTVRPGIEARIKLLFKFEGWDGVNWDGLDKVDM